MTTALPEFDLNSFLPYQFSVISENLSAELALKYKARFDLTNAEWRILINLAYSDTCSVRDIQKRVNLDKPKVSRAVARLESRGLLSKDTSAQDRRLLDLALTDEGRVLVAKLVPLALDFQAELQTRLRKSFAELSAALSILMPETKE